MASLFGIPSKKKVSSVPNIFNRTPQNTASIGNLSSNLKLENPNQTPAAPTPSPAASERPNVPTVIRDGDTGKITGIRFPDGRTILGIDAKEAQGQIDAFLGKRTVTGAAEETQVLKQQELAKKNAALVSQVGQPSEIAQQPFNVPGVDTGQAVASGIAGAAPGIAGSLLAQGGGATALAAGTGIAASGGTLAAIGGAVAVAGFLAGVRSNIKAQREGEIQDIGNALNDRIKNLNQYAVAAKIHPENAEEYVNAFNTELDYILKDYGKLKLETQASVNKFVGVDGTPQLGDYSRFYEPDGTRDRLIAKMQTALLQPGDLTLGDLNEIQNTQ